MGRKVWTRRPAATALALIACGAAVVFHYRAAGFIRNIIEGIGIMSGASVLGGLFIMFVLAVVIECAGRKVLAWCLAGTVLVVGIAFAIVSVQNTIDGLQGDAARGDIGALNSALVLYKDDVAAKHFPADALRQLLRDDAPGWSGPYMATITADPWNNQYTFTSNGSNYTLQSIHEGRFGKIITIRYVFSNGVVESMP